jgi:uncharacterized membrane protein YtjA (UPF0391 family)
MMIWTLLFLTLALLAAAMVTLRDRSTLTLIIKVLFYFFLVLFLISVFTMLFNSLPSPISNKQPLLPI